MAGMSQFKTNPERYEENTCKKALQMLDMQGLFSESARSRTEDPILKRDVLYQLSY